MNNEGNLGTYIRDGVIRDHLEFLSRMTRSLSPKRFSNSIEVKESIRKIIQRIQILDENVGKRKILIMSSAMMGEGYLLMITDAPRSSLIDLCAAMSELDGKDLSCYFRDFKRDWYVKILIDAQVDSSEAYDLTDPDNDIELIGYDENYIYWDDLESIEVEIKNSYLQELFQSLEKAAFNRPEFMDDKCMDIYGSITSLYEELEDYLYTRRV